MNLLNIEKIERGVENWANTSKISAITNYKRLISYLKENNNITIKEGDYYTDVSMKDINDFILKIGSISSYQSINIRVGAFNKLFTEVLNIPTKFSNIPPSEIIKNNEGIYSKEEIVAICNQFINAQDRFLIYGVWYGLKDKRVDDITNIKVADIDFDRNIIKIGDKEIPMDDILRTYAHLTIEEDIYFKLGDISDTNGSYELNMNNPYMIKAKPQRNNNDGLNRMTFNGMRTRINNLNYSLEEYGIILKPQKLYMGGVIYKMYEEHNKNGTVWNNSTIKEFKDKYNISAFSIDTLLAYKNKYN